MKLPPGQPRVCVCVCVFICAYVCACVTDERERMACILSLLSLLSTASTPLCDSNWIENTCRENSRKIHRRRLTVFSSGDIWCSRSSCAFRISIKFCTSIDTLSPSVLHMAASVCVSFPGCFTQRERELFLSLALSLSLSLGWSSCLHSPLSARFPDCTLIKITTNEAFSALHLSYQSVELSSSSFIFCIPSQLILCVNLQLGCSSSSIVCS